MQTMYFFSFFSLLIIRKFWFAFPNDAAKVQPGYYRRIAQVIHGYCNLTMSWDCNNNETALSRRSIEKIGDNRITPDRITPEGWTWQSVHRREWEGPLRCRRGRLRHSWRWQGRDLCRRVFGYAPYLLGRSVRKYVPSVGALSLNHCRSQRTHIIGNLHGLQVYSWFQREMHP